MQSWFSLVSSTFFSCLLLFFLPNRKDVHGQVMNGHIIINPEKERKIERVADKLFKNVGKVRSDLVSLSTVNIL